MHGFPLTTTAAWIAATVTIVCGAILATWRCTQVPARARVFYDVTLLLMSLAVVAHLGVALNLGNYTYAPHETTYVPRNIEWALTSPLFLLMLAEIVGRLVGRRLRFIDMAMAILSVGSILVWLFAIFTLESNPGVGHLLFLVACLGIAGVGWYVYDLARTIRTCVTISLTARTHVFQILAVWALLWLSYPGVYELYLLGIVGHDVRVFLYIVLDVMERGLCNIALLHPALLTELLVAERRAPTSEPERMSLCHSLARSLPDHPVTATGITHP